MSKSKINISNTLYSIYFDNVVDANIYMLPKIEAEEIWENNIHEKAHSYFKLPDDNWVVKNEKELGDWLYCFNNRGCNIVDNILDVSFNWNDSDIVWFCKNNESVLETNWYVFKKNWRAFLNCEDDGSIILNKSMKGIALLFLSNNKFYKIKKL